LIAYGASVNAKNNENTSPLILACRENNLPLVRLLLQNGAAQTINHCKRESALHIAAFYADQKIIQLLLDHGADKTLLNSSNRIPAQQATRPKIRALLETL
jgi:ankyrin repeat protein